MIQIINFLKNLVGIILLIILVYFLGQILNYLSPLLIDKGWSAYFLVVFLESIVMTGLVLLQTILFMPFLYLITSKVAKISCSIITIIGLIISLITPWQFANAIGFSFIVIVWVFTLTIFICALYFSLFFAILSSKND